MPRHQKKARRWIGGGQIAPLTRLPQRSCRIAGWLPTHSIGLSSGKKNPAKPRPAAVGSGPHVALPSRSRGFRLDLVPRHGHVLLSAVIDGNKNCR